MMQQRSRPKDGWKLGRDSYTKMITWYADGNIRTWYSLDWRHRYSPARDRQLGMLRHYRRLRQWGRRCTTAVIYDTATGLPLAKYREGEPVSPEEHQHL